MVRGVRGFCIVQSADRRAGLTAAMQTASGLVPAQFREADVAVLAPDGNRWLLADLAGQLQFQQGYYPAGDQRVVILDQADQMDPRAAENLLLVVEEPVSEVLYIAVTSSASALLPTLQSRSVVTIDADPRAVGDLGAEIGVPVPAVVERVVAGCPLTDAALRGGASEKVADVVGTLDVAFSGQGVGAFFSGYSAAKSLRAAAKAVTGKAEKDQFTKHVLRELAAAWLGERQRGAVAELRRDGSAAASSRITALDECRQMLSVHIPLEHVLIRAAAVVA